jgi:hypothetical protein
MGWNQARPAISKSIAGAEAVTVGPRHCDEACCGLWRRGYSKPLPFWLLRLLAEMRDSVTQRSVGDLQQARERTVEFQDQEDRP